MNPEEVVNELEEAAQAPAEEVPDATPKTETQTETEAPAQPEA